MCMYVMCTLYSVHTVFTSRSPPYVYTTHVLHLTALGPATLFAIFYGSADEIKNSILFAEIRKLYKNIVLY